MMDAQRLQKLILSLMHDPSFRSRLQNKPSPFLQRRGCTLEEIEHVLSFDPRLYEADSLRSDRILTGLLDIFPVSVWSALQSETFRQLRGFFRTDSFHTVLWDGGYVFERFSSYLVTEIGADASFVALENAIESVRSTKVPADECSEPTHYVLHPKVRLVTLEAGVFDAYLAAQGTIQRSTLTGAEFLLEIDDGPLTVPTTQADEYILVESADEPQIGPISGSLASTLLFLESSRRHDQLTQKLIDEGAAEHECDELISHFQEHGWIKGQVFTP
ncbi:MAG: hypothetical protein ACPGQS_02630 [Bradymonadia bacterium]